MLKNFMIFPPQQGGPGGFGGLTWDYFNCPTTPGGEIRRPAVPGNQSTSMLFASLTRMGEKLAWFSSHHALRCLIGGLRAKYHTPLSLRHDKQGGSTYISLQIY